MRVALGNKNHLSVKRFMNVFAKYHPKVRNLELCMPMFEAPKPESLYLYQVPHLDYRVPIVVTNIQTLEQMNVLGHNNFLCVKINSHEGHYSFNNSKIKWDYELEDNGNIEDFTLQIEEFIVTSELRALRMMNAFKRVIGASE